MENFWLIIICCLVLIIVGVYIILSAIYNWHQDVMPRKVLARIIKEVLSPIGYRYFSGTIGAIFIIAPIVFFTYIYIIPNFSSPKSKTVMVTAKYINGTSSTRYPNSSNEEGVTSLATVSFSVDNAEHIRNDFEFFDSISFENIGIDCIPDYVFDMKNLEVINLKNNKLKNLPVASILKLTRLRKIILINNPIDLSLIEKLENDLNIEIITR